MSELKQKADRRQTTSTGTSIRRAPGKGESLESRYGPGRQRLLKPKGVLGDHTPLTPKLDGDHSVVQVGDVCDDGKQEGCFLSERDKSRVLSLIQHHLALSVTLFLDAIRDAKLRDALAPKSNAWSLVVDVLYAAAAAGINPLASGLVPLTKIINSAGMTAPIKGAILRRTALTVAIRQATIRAKKAGHASVAAAIGGDRSDFYDAIVKNIANQSTAVFMHAMTESNDVQRCQLYLHYRAATNAGTKPYKQALDRLLGLYKRNVESIGHKKQPLRIQGIGWSRVGMFAPQGDPNGMLASVPASQFPFNTDGKRYRVYWKFLHWIDSGFQDMAIERERQMRLGEACDLIYLKTQPVCSGGEQVINATDPFVIDTRGALAKVRGGDRR